MEEYDSIFVLWITNLNFRTTEKHLREIFQQFGELTCCKLLLNKDKLSKGIAMIKYEHNKDAQTALTQMTDSMINGRKISIELETEMVPKKNKLQKLNSQQLHLNSITKEQISNEKHHASILNTPNHKNDCSPTKRSNEAPSNSNKSPKSKEKNANQNQTTDRSIGQSPHRKR